MGLSSDSLGSHGGLKWSHSMCLLGACEGHLLGLYERSREVEYRVSHDTGGCEFTVENIGYCFKET